MLESVTRDDFAACLNTIFHLAVQPGQMMELALTEVSELRATPRQQVFSLIFRGPVDTYLPQRIYHLEHDRLGPLDIFLVPVGKDDQGFQYEAVFNRLIEPS